VFNFYHGPILKINIIIIISKKKIAKHYMHIQKAASEGPATPGK